MLMIFYIGINLKIEKNNKKILKIISKIICFKIKKNKIIEY